MRWHREETPPLVGVVIIAVVVDQGHADRHLGARRKISLSPGRDRASNTRSRKSRERKIRLPRDWVTSPATNIKLSKSTLARRAWRIISSEYPSPPRGHRALIRQPPATASPLRSYVQDVVRSASRIFSSTAA